MRIVKACGPLCVVLFLFPFLIAPSHARWAREDEASAYYDEYKVSVQVKKDYSIEEIDEVTVTLLKQEAIKNLSFLQISYTPSIEQVKVLDAQVISGSTVIPISPNMIEDKITISTQSRGFDDVRAIKIAFPSLSVGSKIKYKLWARTLPRTFPDFAGDLFSTDRGLPIHSFSFKLESDIPLEVSIHDPQSQLKIEKRRKDTKTTLTATSLGHLSHSKVEEYLTAFRAPQSPIIYFSTLSKWDDLAKRITAEYEAVLAQPLPVEFKEIAERAKAKGTVQEKVTSVLSALHQVLYYVGDWRTVRGRYFPRPLAEIASTKFGDCKDFSISAVAILRKVGIEASPAWTEVQLDLQKLKGSYTVTFKPPLPVLDFNHAIAWLRIDQKDYWIDPTSTIPYLGKSRPEIAGAPALVLNPTFPHLDVVPLMELSENEIRADRYLLINADETVDELERAEIHGYFAPATRESLEKQGREHLTSEDILSGTKSGTDEANSDVLKVDSGSLGRKTGTQTTAGASVEIPAPTNIMALLQDASQFVGDLVLFGPGKEIRTTQILSGSLVGELPSNCDTTSNWFKSKRTYEKSGNKVSVRTETEVTQAMISNADLKSSFFKNAVEALKNCIAPKTIIFSSKPGPVEFDPALEQPWTMPKWKLLKLKVSKWALDSKDSVLVSLDRKVASNGHAPIFEWAKGKSPDLQIQKALELFRSYRGELMQLVVSKFLMLDLLNENPGLSSARAAASLVTVRGGYEKNSDYESLSIERGRLLAREALKADPLSPLANTAMGFVYLAEKKNENAMRQLEYSFALDPDILDTKRQLAQALNRNKLIERATELAIQTKFWFLQQAIYEEQGKSDLAEQAYQNEIREEPSGWAYLNYGNFLVNHQKYDEAIAQLKLGMNAGRFGMLHRVLSSAYVGKARSELHKENMDEAITLFRKAYEEDSENSYAFSGLGMAYDSLSRKTAESNYKKQAQEYFQQALQMDPQNQEAMTGVGFGPIQQQSPEAMVKIMQSLIENDPEFQKRVEALKALHNHP